MLQRISGLAELDYLSVSQIQNELNLRGYFAATTSPPASVTYTNLEVLGFIVDIALETVGLPLTQTVNTDLTQSEWSEISRIATVVAPELNFRYGTNLAITQLLIDNNLNVRHYWLSSSATTTATPPASLPGITLQAYKAKVIDYALAHYNRTPYPSSAISLSTAEWSNIVNYAYNYDQSIDQNYTISGLSGLGDLGAEILGPCFDASGNLVPCGSTTDVGWGTKWGPTILTLVGSILSLIGTTWSASQMRSQASSLYYQTTGTQLGVGTTRDAEILARQIQAQNPGMSYDQAYRQARILLGLSEKESDLTKYLLPLGIGIGAYLLLRGRS